MADVRKYTEQIAGAKKGKDVRSSIVAAINEVSDENNQYNQVKADILAAQKSVNADVKKNEQVQQAFDADLQEAKSVNSSLVQNTNAAAQQERSLEADISTAVRQEDSLEADISTAAQQERSLELYQLIY